MRVREESRSTVGRREFLRPLFFFHYFFFPRPLLNKRRGIWSEFVAVAVSACYCLLMSFLSMPFRRRRHDEGGRLRVA